MFFTAITYKSFVLISIYNIHACNSSQLIDKCHDKFSDILYGINIININWDAVLKDSILPKLHDFFTIYIGSFSLILLTILCFHVLRCSDKELCCEFVCQLLMPWSKEELQKIIPEINGMLELHKEHTNHKLYPCFFYWELPFNIIYLQWSLIQ